MRGRVAQWLIVGLFVSVFGSTTTGTAEAISCGPEDFLVSGTFLDQTTGEPASVVATLTFLGTLTSGTSGEWEVRTVLPSSSYQICLPSDADTYFVEARASGYLLDQGGGWDAEIRPVPPPGSRLTLDISQVRAADLYQNELFFHRGDGLYRAYDPRLNGSLPAPLLAGEDWPMIGDWQFSHIPRLQIGLAGSRFLFAYGPAGEMYVLDDPITYQESGFAESRRRYVGTDASWDLVAQTLTNGVLFYRESDGQYQWREFYVEMERDVTLVDGASGGDWTRGWTSIVPINLDDDIWTQEVLFYRKTDGLYRYYRLRSDGSIGRPMLAGDDYTRGWDQIVAVDLDGDGQDEIFFYREDGLFRYYDIRADGTIPRPLTSGDNYTRAWGSITEFESCRVGDEWECAPPG